VAGPTDYGTHAAALAEELLDARGERRRVLEEEAVAGARVDLDLRVREVLGEQVRCSFGEGALRSAMTVAPRAARRARVAP
jgi:hypothetical protein